MEHSLALAGLLVVLGAIIVNVAVLSLPSGVKLHETGKMKVVIEDKNLLVFISKPYTCKGDLNITYSTTSTGSCALYIPATVFESAVDDEKRKSTCQLKKSHGNVVDIELIALPSVCSIILTNAKLPGEAETQSNGASFKNILTIVVIVLLVVMVIVCPFLGGWYFLNSRRKKRNSTTTRMEPTAQEPQSSVNQPTTTAKRKI